MFMSEPSSGVPRARTIAYGARCAYMSHSLNSFKGGYTGDYIGAYYRGLHY